MSRDRRFPVLIAGLIVAALVLSVAAIQTQQPAPLMLAAPQEVSPSTQEYAPQLATITALLVGTATLVPTATRPRDPTSTPRPSCSSDTPAQTVCYGATLVPTLAPANVIAPPMQIPTWPGAEMQTPGSAYLYTGLPMKGGGDRER